MADAFRWTLGVVAALVALAVGCCVLSWAGSVTLLLLARLLGRYQHWRHGTTCGEKIGSNGPCDLPPYHGPRHEYTEISYRTKEPFRVAFGGDAGCSWSFGIDMPAARQTEVGR